MISTYWRIYGNLPKHALTNIEIDSIMSNRKGYIGTFAADRVPHLKYNESCIINTDKTGETGSHWCALIRSKSKTWFYDSFGRTENELGFIYEWNETNPNIEQKMTTETGAINTSCGAHCIAFLTTCYDFSILSVVKIL